MLRLPPFRHLAPTSIEEACRVLAGEGKRARVVAGGTDLWPNMKRRHQHADVVASLMRIGELSGVEGDGGGLVVGATTPLADLERSPDVRSRFPMLARAVASISSPPLRNMATLGGNVLVDTRCTYYNQTEEWRKSIDYCLKEAGTVCWVAPGSPTCWAHSASDAAPALCALDAQVVLRSTQGEREVPINKLYKNDGIDYLTKRSDEILTRILLPASSDDSRCRTAFWKLRRRASIDFAVLSVAVAVWTNAEQVVRRARIVLGSVASRPIAVEKAEAFLLDRTLDRESISEAARLARRAATPMDNTDFRTQWRGLMVERYAAAALAEAAGLPTGRFDPPHPSLLV